MRRALGSVARVAGCLVGAALAAVGLLLLESYRLHGPRGWEPIPATMLGVACGFLVLGSLVGVGLLLWHRAGVRTLVGLLLVSLAIILGGFAADMAVGVFPARHLGDRQFLFVSLLNVVAACAFFGVRFAVGGPVRHHRRRLESRLRVDDSARDGDALPRHPDAGGASDSPRAITASRASRLLWKFWRLVVLAVAIVFLGGGLLGLIEEILLAAEGRGDITGCTLCAACVLLGVLLLALAWRYRGGAWTALGAFLVAMGVMCAGKGLEGGIGVVHAQSSGQPMRSAGIDLMAGTVLALALAVVGLPCLALGHRRHRRLNGEVAS